MILLVVLCRFLLAVVVVAVTVVLCYYKGQYSIVCFFLLKEAHLKTNLEEPQNAIISTLFYLKQVSEASFSFKTNKQKQLTLESVWLSLGARLSYIKFQSYYYLHNFPKVILTLH